LVTFLPVDLPSVGGSKGIAVEPLLLRRDPTLFPAPSFTAVQMNEVFFPCSPLLRPFGPLAFYGFYISVFPPRMISFSPFVPLVFRIPDAPSSLYSLARNVCYPSPSLPPCFSSLSSFFRVGVSPLFDPSCGLGPLSPCTMPPSFFALTLDVLLSALTLIACLCVSPLPSIVVEFPGLTFPPPGLRRQLGRTDPSFLSVVPFYLPLFPLRNSSGLRLSFVWTVRPFIY